MTLRKLQILAEKELKKIVLSARKQKKLAKVLAHGKVQVEVFFVSEKKMTAINFQYRKKKKSTDVLSFPVPKDFQKLGVLGSLVICVPVMKKQAKEVGHSAHEELRVLLVHGVLHLLGYDHEKSSRDAKAMHKIEAQLLDGMGLIQRAGF